MRRPDTSSVLLLAVMLLAGCRHDWREADEFAQQVRCGMTADQIRSLVKQSGMSQDRVWNGSSNILIIKPYELDFIHVLLQGGEAVAVQRGNHVAFTTGMEFGVIRMLCGAAPIPDRTFWDFERRTATPKPPTSP